jgi:REP element-mobilizing transposase RayT
MGFKYAIRSDKLHFLTHTVVDWIDVFTLRELAEVVLDSLNYCIREKGLEVYVWCLMPSHLHMIARPAEGAKQDLSGIMRDFKKFTSKAIVNEISKIMEGRKEWMLRHFQTDQTLFRFGRKGCILLSCLRENSRIRRWITYTKIRW